MSQSDSVYFNNIGSAVVLGICAVALVLCGGFFPLNFSIFFAGVPLFASYLSKGTKNGTISSIVCIGFVLAFCKIETSVDIILNVVLPPSIIGHFFIKCISKNRKTWWYPESFLLRNFIVISLVSLIFMSLTFYTEKHMAKAFDIAIDAIPNKNSPEICFVIQYLKSFIKYSLGISIFSKMIATISSFQIAYFICKKKKMNIRNEFSILNLSIPNWMAVLPIISLTIAKVAPFFSFVCSGIFVVSLVAPMLAGFSLLHFFAHNKQRRSILTTAYIFLLIFPLPMIISAVAIGIVDSFCKIRQLITK